MIGEMSEVPAAPTLPGELPLLPLRGSVVFPLTLQPLAVNRAVSVAAVNAALAADRMVLLAMQKTDADDPGPDDLHDVATVGIIRQMARAPHGLNIIVEGIARVRVTLVTRTDEIFKGQLSPFPEAMETGVEVDAYVRRIQELVEKALSLATGLSQEVKQLVANIDSPVCLISFCGSPVRRPCVRSPQNGYRRAVAISRKPAMNCGLLLSRNACVSGVLR